MAHIRDVNVEAMEVMRVRSFKRKPGNFGQDVLETMTWVHPRNGTKNNTKNGGICEALVTNLPNHHFGYLC